MTVHALVCASVKVSVESVVESLVSRYETHFHKKGGLGEKNAMDGMEIAENGPSEFKADRLLTAAMNRYWKTETKSGQWHFSRQSSHNILDYGSCGKTSMKVLQQSSKYPVMDL